MAQPIRVTLTRGEYVRYCRNRADLTMQQLSDAMNTVLPTSDHVSQSWISRVEDDSPNAAITALRAIALARTLGCDTELLGIEPADITRVAQLAASPHGTGNLPEILPKRPSSCIAHRGPREDSSGLQSPVLHAV